MAVQILNVGEWGAALELDGTETPSKVRVELEYEDTTNILTLIRVTNSSGVDVTVTVTRRSDGRTISRVFGQGITTQNLPQQASQRVNFVAYPGGKWSGFSVDVRFPGQ